MIGKFSTVEIKYQIKEAISLDMQTYRYQTQQSIIAYRINVTFEVQRARDTRLRI